MKSKSNFAVQRHKRSRYKLLIDPLVVKDSRLSWFYNQWMYLLASFPHVYSVRLNAGFTKKIPSWQFRFPTVTECCLHSICLKQICYVLRSALCQNSVIAACVNKWTKHCSIRSWLPCDHSVYTHHVLLITCMSPGH